MPTIDDLRAVLHDRATNTGDIDTVLSRVTARAGHRHGRLAASLSAACVLALAGGLVFGTDASHEHSSPPAGAPPAQAYTYAGPTLAGSLIPSGQRRQAEPFTARLLDGGSFDLADHRGRVVVLNFWASWCGPCRGQMTMLERSADQAAAQPITIVGVDTKETSKKAPRVFVREHHISYPVIWDPHGRTAAELGTIPTQALPVTVLIDTKHRVAAVYNGMTTPSDIHQALDDLVDES